MENRKRIPPRMLLTGVISMFGIRVNPVRYLTLATPGAQRSNEQDQALSLERPGLTRNKPEQTIGSPEKQHIIIAHIKNPEPGPMVIGHNIGLRRNRGKSGPDEVMFSIRRNEPQHEDRNDTQRQNPPRSSELIVPRKTKHQNQIGNRE